MTRGGEVEKEGNGRDAHGRGKDLCCVCGRSGAALTRHHLVPRMVDGRKSTRRRVGGDKVGLVALVCAACHRQIHSVFTETELGRDFNTPDKIRSHPEIRKFVAWVSKQPPTTLFPCRKRRR